MGDPISDRPVRTQRWQEAVIRPGRPWKFRVVWPQIVGTLHDIAMARDYLVGILNHSNREAIQLLKNQVNSIKIGLNWDTVFLNPHEPVRGLKGIYARVPYCGEAEKCGEDMVVDRPLVPRAWHRSKYILSEEVRGRVLSSG